jgi:hypothetical protein
MPLILKINKILFKIILEKKVVKLSIIKYHKIIYNKMRIYFIIWNQSLKGFVLMINKTNRFIKIIKLNKIYKIKYSKNI